MTPTQSTLQSRHLCILSSYSNVTEKTCKISNETSIKDCEVFIRRVFIKQINGWEQYSIISINDKM